MTIQPPISSKNGVRLTNFKFNNLVCGRKTFPDNFHPVVTFALGISTEIDDVFSLVLDSKCMAFPFRSAAIEHSFYKVYLG